MLSKIRFPCHSSQFSISRGQARSLLCDPFHTARSAWLISLCVVAHLEDSALLCAELQHTLSRRLFARASVGNQRFPIFRNGTGGLSVPDAWSVSTYSFGVQALSPRECHGCDTPQKADGSLPQRKGNRDIRAKPLISKEHMCLCLFISSVLSYKRQNPQVLFWLLSQSSNIAWRRERAGKAFERLGLCQNSNTVLA